jgi:hypothetical protein
MRFEFLGPIGHHLRVRVGQQTAGSRTLRNNLRPLRLFLLRMAVIELVCLAFLAFTIYAQAGYHAGQAWRATLAAAGLTLPARLPPGVKSDRDSLVLALIFSGFMAFIVLIIPAVLGFWGRSGTRRGSQGEEGVAVPNYPPPQRPAARNGESETKPHEIAGQSGKGLVRWSGVLSALMFVCAILGVAALATLAFNYFHHPLEPTFYWVGWVVAFSLATGFGPGHPPDMGPGRAGKKLYLRAYFRAAPVWLRTAVIAVGTLLAILCARTGYIAIKRPGDFGDNLMSDNFAVALAFLFFVDAMAFAAPSKNRNGDESNV